MILKHGTTALRYSIVIIFRAKLFVSKIITFCPLFGAREQNIGKICITYVYECLWLRMDFRCGKRWNSCTELYVVAADYGWSYHFHSFSLWVSSPFTSVRREISSRGVGIFIKNTFIAPILQVGFKNFGICNFAVVPFLSVVCSFDPLQCNYFNECKAIKMQCNAITFTMIPLRWLFAEEHINWAVSSKFYCYGVISVENNVQNDYPNSNCAISNQRKWIKENVIKTCHFHHPNSIANIFQHTQSLLIQ